MNIRSFIPFLLFFVLTSCNNGYYTEEDFFSVPKADVHVHIASSRGSFEEQAGNDNFILLTINVDVADSLSVRQQYNYAVESVNRYKGRVFYSSTFYFDTTRWGNDNWARRAVSQIDGYLEAKPASVKLWKNIGMTARDRAGKFIMIDDPLLDPVFDFIIKKGIPVTGHLGEPRNCWLPLAEMTVSGDSSYFAENPQYHMYLHPDYPSYEDQINARDHLLEKHPDMVFIGCHLGSLEYDVDELAKRLDRFPNMAVDLAGRICHLQYQSVKDYEKVRNFCIRYQDRILYGTDLSDEGKDDPGRLKDWMHKTWTGDWKYFVTGDEMTTGNFRGSFNGLHLPKKVVDKIFYQNAVKWYRLPVPDTRLPVTGS